MIRRTLFLAVLLAVGVCGAARAQGPAYSASPPTKGALYSDGQSGRYLLGGTWLYRADTSDVGLAQGWWRNVASTDGWSTTTIPNAYNAGDFSQASMNGYVGWYRRDFTVPAGAFASYVPNASRHWIIRFESVNYRATVWLNGRQIGSHAGAYVPWELDLSGLHSGVNRLIVRVDNRRTAADLPPGPGGQWWNYGGILREVYLRAVQTADLEQVQIRTLHPCPRCEANIEEQVLVRNVTGSRQKVSLRGSYGRATINFGSTTIAPHATWTAAGSVRVPHPSLWAPGHPKLYTATLSLSDSRGRRLGGYLTDSGIRTITVKDGHLELNGRQLNLRGVNLHEQTLQTGAAMTPAQDAQLMSYVQQLGATVIRAHYPVGPEMEEMADRDGILIWSEVPVYQVQSQYLDQPAWLAHAHAMLEDNILSNENHPSVLLWSIGNELPAGVTPAEAKYIAGAAALAKKLDPTRPVGMAISNWPGLGCQQKAYAPLDVIGDNEYFGWFDAGGGLDDDRDALGPFLDTVRACYSKQAIMITEFGFDGSRDGPVDERGHVRVPGQLGGVPSGSVRDQAVAVGSDVLRGPELRRVPDLFGRRSAPGSAVQPEGAGRLRGRSEAGVFGRVADLPLDPADRAIGR